MISGFIFSLATVGNRLLPCRMVMNRVAAQNAREKKRQYVEDLERKLSQLETQVGL